MIPSTLISENNHHHHHHHECDATNTESPIFVSEKGDGNSLLPTSSSSSSLSPQHETYQHNRHQHYTAMNYNHSSLSVESEATMTTSSSPKRQQLPKQQQQQNQQQQFKSASSVYSSSTRYHPAQYPIGLKILVSNNVAGSIIGRGGQTISEFQMQSKARIKLSQSGEYFPTTQDRVCLIQGEDIISMKAAIRLLLARMHLLQDHQLHSISLPCNYNNNNNNNNDNDP
jgi:KH domain